MDFFYFQKICKHGAYECFGWCSQVDLQRRKARKEAGSDPAMLQSYRQIPHSHDETWFGFFHILFIHLLDTMHLIFIFFVNLMLNFLR